MYRINSAQTVETVQKLQRDVKRLCQDTENREREEVFERYRNNPNATSDSSEITSPYNLPIHRFLTRTASFVSSRSRESLNVGMAVSDDSSERSRTMHLLNDYSEPLYESQVRAQRPPQGTEMGINISSGPTTASHRLTRTRKLPTIHASKTYSGHEKVFDIHPIQRSSQVSNTNKDSQNTQIDDEIASMKQRLLDGPSPPLTARDTETLVGLVRAAAQMRNNFEQMKAFIQEQDSLILSQGRGGGILDGFAAGSAVLSSQGIPPGPSEDVRRQRKE